MYYIYKITNLINGKTYIGQHKYKELNDYYMGSGKHLINAQKKYDIKNFKKEILVFNVAKKEHIDLLEKTFIASEREKVGVENCYNITDGGGGGSGKGRHHKHHKASFKGRHHSEETKKRLSEASKGNQNHKGFHHSEDARKKMSAAWDYDKHFTEERRKKQSETFKLLRWFNNGERSIRAKECPEGFVPGRLKK